MWRIKVPVCNRDTGLHWQIQSLDHFLRRKIIGGYDMLIGQLRVQRLLVRREMPRSNCIVELYPLTNLERVYIRDSYLKWKARGLI